MVPLLFIDSVGKVDAYRYATYAGLALWFLSLIPALMLRTYEAEERPDDQLRDDQKAELGASGGSATRGIRGIFSRISHPRRIAFFVITSAFASLAFGVVGPLFSVVFHEGHLHAEESEISIMFAVAELTLATATLLTPLLAARMLRVDAIAVTRLIGIPFVLGMGLLPLIMNEGGVLLLLVGFS